MSDDIELLRECRAAIDMVLKCATMPGYRQRAEDQARETIGRIDARLAQPEAAPERESDSVCKEADGCPTEMAVLKRFWRAHQPEAKPYSNADSRVYGKEYQGTTEWSIGPSRVPEYTHVPLTQVGTMEVRYKPEQPEAAEPDEPAEVLAGRLIDAWCADKGKQIPWAKAIQIVAIVTKQPDDERDRLLKMGDENGSCEMCGRSDAAPVAPKPEAAEPRVERRIYPDDRKLPYQYRNAQGRRCTSWHERRAAPVAAQPSEPKRQHVLYQDGDKDIPKAILDSNGQVVLGMCKVCRRAESELNNYEPCRVPPQPGALPDVELADKLERLIENWDHPGFYPVDMEKSAAQRIIAFLRKESTR